jgi:high-affinity iron transporter
MAVVVCVLLYRSAVRLDLGKFFTRTAVLLIVIAAGVLAYGLGDLQDAGWLPGRSWAAFDVSAHIDPGAWWVTLIAGVTELTPRMTWLQVVAYLVYSVSVLTVFARAGTVPSPEPATKVAEPAVAGSPVSETPVPGRAPSRRRLVVLAGAALFLPPLVAVLLIAFAPGAEHRGGQALRVTPTACAPGWSGTRSGSASFSVANKSGHTVEVNLVQAETQGVIAEIETLGPATTATMSATLAPGGYFFRCLADGLPPSTSATVQTGPGPATATTTDPANTAVVPVAMTVKPVAVNDLQPAATAYDDYVRPQLATLLSQVATLRSDIAAGKLAPAQRDWLAAQLTWEQVGAAYDSFADLGDAIDGLPQAHPDGVNDTGFTGLHRLEYGLWHNQSSSALLPVADQLSADVCTLRAKLPRITVDPTDMPTRAHEILEDALRDHLNGLTDQGSGAAYPETWADVQGTRVVLGELAPLINDRAPTLLPVVNTQLDTLTQALSGTQSGGTWQPVSAVSQPARQRVDAAIGAVLENLALVPDLLEVPAH